MDVIITKNSRKDLDDANKEITDYFLSKSSLFCCDSFKAYFKKFAGWDYNSGRFTIVNEITYEGHSSVPINYCPFCGEKIEYEDKPSKKK